MADNEFYDPPQPSASRPVDPAASEQPATSPLQAPQYPAPGYQPNPQSGSPNQPDQPPSTAPYPPIGYAEAGYGIGPSTTSQWPGAGGYGTATGNYPNPTAGYGPSSTGSYPTPTDGYGTYGGHPDQPHSSSGDQSATDGRRRRFVPLLAVGLIAALIGGGVGAITVAVADRNNDSVNTGLTITNNTAAPSVPTNGTIGAAAGKIRPSVVTINETSGQSGGTGSGVILRPDGYILTNDHVISLAAQGGSLRVTLSDGRTASASIVGRDTSDDLAVIKVNGLGNLTPATFGKSSALSVGQTVVAVGAPLGLSDTVTSGIVSNTARPVRAGDNDQAVFQAIQTDAAINPGNSGGPLVDLNGSVVGINAAIATDSSGGGLQIPGQTQQSGNIGIGFAIPSDEASRIASELIATGKAFHAVLGVSVRSASSSTTAGVTLAAVNAGSGAARAGLKVGDLITAVDGRLVTTADSLIAAVRSYAPGTPVKVTYTRGGTTSTVTVTLDKSDQ